MKTKLKKHGKNTSSVDIHTTHHGLWLLVNDIEYFLSFKEFPWFEKAKLADIYDVRAVSPTHLYWKKLDIDLDLESVQDLEKYPLIAKS